LAGVVLLGALDYVLDLVVAEVEVNIRVLDQLQEVLLLLKNLTFQNSS
jgi:hypothetical protein